jgi:hypothetical protein
VRRADAWLLMVLILSCFTLIWVLSGVYVGANMRRLQASSPQSVLEVGAAPPLDLHTPHLESLLPAESHIVSRLDADLDNDGREETVVAFNGESDGVQEGHTGLMVFEREGTSYSGAWQVLTGSERRVSALLVQEINRDGVVEILLFNTADDEIAHYLYVYAWRGPSYVPLRPRGGPFEGGEGFESAYYPPTLHDLDLDDSLDIVCFREGASDLVLDPIVYIWSGEAYAYTDLIITRPRPVPSLEESSNED